MRRGLFCLCCGLVFLFFGALGFVFAGGSYSFVIGHLAAALMLFTGGALFCGYSGLVGMLQASRGPGWALLRRICIVAALLGGLIGINIVAANLSWSIDTTLEQVFSLTDESAATLKGLQSSVEIIAVRPDRPQELQRRKELLARYAAARPELVRTRLLDPVQNPQQALALGLQAGEEVILLFESAAPVRLQSAQEEAITAAIARHESGAQRRAYFLTGHGEPDVHSVKPDGLSELQALLRREQISAEPLLLAERGTVPDDAALIAIVAPSEAPPGPELQALAEYVRGGGSVLVFLEPPVADSLAAFVQAYGIQPEPAVVLDRTRRLFDAPETGWQIMTRSYGDHEITRGLTDTDLSVFLLGVPLTIAPGKERSGSIRPLIRSPGSAWGETDLEALFAATPEASFEPAEDLKGPVHMAVSAELYHNAGLSSRIVVYGDSSWLRNQNVKVYSNEKLAARTFLWGAGDDHQMITRPRSFRKSVLLISTPVFRQLLVGSFLIPELLFLFGLLVWWRRTRLTEPVI